MKQIIVTIPLKGPVKIETTGFTGNECAEATQKIQSRLGVTVSDTPTAEMFETVQEAEGQSNG